MVYFILSAKIVELNLKVFFQLTNTDYFDHTTSKYSIIVANR